MGMGIDGTTTTEVAGDLLFMQLEKCDVTLGTHASLIGRVPREPELLDILRQIASALEHLHSCCIVHLDVKPDNIFMLCPPYLMNENNGGDSTIEGEEEDKDEWAPPGTVYKLGDFGQAMHLDLIKGGARKGAGVGVTEGDCRYLPLEVMNSDYSALEKADIFALGATILDLAMGKGLPENGQLYQDLRAGKLPLLPTVPASLVKMIKSLMHPNPGKRPTAAQVLKSPLLVNSSNGTNASMKGKQPHTGLAAGATIDENKQSNTAV
jgi:wee1-like protein kinase